ncbi:flavin reductase family protein [Sphaerisporangium corydalis]|uniref:Flavin reductase family protein n=1 Tax=Sphaerisporangium corydalis TaxID=1441875 RepID=A0ABV9EFK1_9ACTN|nr:flavin reductase family protein [Sphaerisporangium corydalis]
MHHGPVENQVDQAVFRKVTGRFATGVAVATTLHGGVDHAMTVNSVASVSLDPLLVLVCVERIARFHDAVLAAGIFGISILGEDGEEASRAFAKRGRTLHGQLDRWSHRRGTLGLALFDTAIATLECRTRAVHDGGDHSIVVGDVVSAHAPRDHAPLVYYAGRYRHLRPPGR